MSRPDDLVPEQEFAVAPEPNIAGRVSFLKRVNSHRTAMPKRLGFASSRTPMETKMNSTERALRLPKAQTRAMRVSPSDAERQLILSVWLVALLIAATTVTATVGLFA